MILQIIGASKSGHATTDDDKIHFAFYIFGKFRQLMIAESMPSRKIVASPGGYLVASFGGKKLFLCLGEIELIGERVSQIQCARRCQLAR